MKKYSRLPIDFLKKELKSLEKSYEQFKEIYDYFHSEAMGIENKDVEKKLALPKENYKYIFIRLYDPVYTANLPAELLKKGQYITNTTKTLRHMLQSVLICQIIFMDLQSVATMILKKNNAVILIPAHTCRLVILKSHFTILTQ